MHASQVSEAQVLSQQAYMLYYARDDKYLPQGVPPLSVPPLAVPTKPSTGQANAGSPRPAVRHPTVTDEPGRAGRITGIGPTPSPRPRVPLSAGTGGERRGVPLPAPSAPQAASPVHWDGSGNPSPGCCDQR
jgi:hypothetical protein